jgi:transcription elongation GreA/GreB family factor
MSRAFVKELDGEAGEDLPELAVSPHRNLVTPSGLAQIERTLHRLDSELTDARAAGDKPLVARIERDLRYFRQRKATAELVQPTGSTDKVRFGSRVALETRAGERVEFSIVGEDESDPSRGLISYVSPLAKSLMGGSVGDRVAFMDTEAEIVGVESGRR